ncbi:hypothetical protein N8315_09955 [Octadecabacter sp.]|nr:hypothetical protein [Octadecabacter sp.]MDC1381721.1 hypothetical protein [Octadecabacter sp.]
MKHIHALFICLMAFASPSVAETDPVPYEEFLAENDISFTASEVLEDYRSFGCEENEGVRDYRPNIDYDPVFMMRENSYRKVQLTGEGVKAELIQTRDMMCGHLHMEYCGSGGCRSHIVFDGLVYDIRGQLFLLVPEPSYEGASTASTLLAVIAWWGSVSACLTQADEETDPAYRVNYNS